MFLTDEEIEYIDKNLHKKMFIDLVLDISEKRNTRISLIEVIDFYKYYLNREILNEKFGIRKI